MSKIAAYLLLTIMIIFSLTGISEAAAPCASKHLYIVALSVCGTTCKNPHELHRHCLKRSTFDFQDIETICCP
ncbi:hypothetical protein GCK72_011681 [Caenorhabditis remanei]|uniref:Uncharacterized protein n=1 Tax=Caenorhabditis remanei TaxID=31234 RepID=A0A6A5H8G2_CAERE|nr:hypothetical protein GCK72_011681 [Caenorhabditis remanei]KAF1763415.1 hypothetical protein GCK72_011681 [Caenorhabditis remanei]